MALSDLNLYILIAAMLLLLLLILIKLDARRPPTRSMSTRVAVVTGSCGHHGIGCAIAKKLCLQFEGDVILTGSDQLAGKVAVRRILEELKISSINLTFAHVNIDNDKHVQQLHDMLLANYGGLDTLVNNEAIAFDRGVNVPREILQKLAVDTINKNYWATAKLCDSLFPILKKGARVVNITDTGMLGNVPDAALRQQLASEDLDRNTLDQLVRQYITDVTSNVNDKSRWPVSAYTMSKVFLAALTRVQQKYIDTTRPFDKILVNACHPGNDEYDDEMTPHVAAECPAYLALLPPALAGPKGKMFWSDCKEVDWPGPFCGSEMKRG